MTNECRDCGATLPDDAPGGACPRCLLAQGLHSGDPTTANMPNVDEIAERFPALDILEPLGRGGMGAVYKARQKSLDRVVALKILMPGEGDRAAFADRFGREARTMARLDHPNIVRVFDFGDADGLYFLVMEYVEGVNLREAMNREALEPKEALAIVPQVCDALQYAHDRGVVHRDIKPENILIDRAGSVKIADFGLAKLLMPGTDERNITGTGQVMGTLNYMAPEQYRTPQDVDHRADIFSLGVVFYEMLTGELPVGRFAPPSRRAGVDVRLDEVVYRTLEREPDQRFQAASEVRTRVDSIAGDPRRFAPPHGYPHRPPPFPPPPVDSRLSKMAIFGGFATPLAITLSIVAASVLPARTADGDPTANSVLIPVGVIAIAVLGIVLSVIAWARISGSRGALRGLGFAITGTFLPIGLLVLAVPMAMFLMVGGELTELPEEMAASVAPIDDAEMMPEPWPEVPASPPRDVVPPEPELESVNGMEVIGGVNLRDDRDRAIASQKIGERMDALLDRLDGDLMDPVRLRSLYPPDTTVALIEGMASTQIDSLRDSGSLGLPLIRFETLPVPLGQYRIERVHLDANGTAATVRLLAEGDYRLSFGMLKQFGEWWFAPNKIKRE